MKTLIEKKCLFTAITLLIWLAPTALFAQGKNQVTVVDQLGRGVSGVTVRLYEGTTGVCKCEGADCVVAPTESDVTKRNGTASFGKGRGGLKPNTDYAISIDDKCLTFRECADPTIDCGYSGSVYKVKTDKKGKFGGFTITQPQ